MKQRLQYEKGQSVVELALGLPLLTALLMIVVEVGRVCLVAISLASAAHAGVQYGAQNLTTVSDNAGMQSAAAADAPSLAGLNVTASHFCQCSDGSSSTCLATDCSTSHRLTYVQINASATYTPWFNWPGVPASTTLTSQAVMRVNQ